jgi:hypothetical protein
LFVKLLEAAEPKQETLRAWDEYIRIVNLNAAKSAAGDSQFLWTDESQDMARRLQQNEVVITDHDPNEVPQGIIHDWVGAVFVPNVTLDQALSVIENYDRYNEFYQPLVRKCTILARDGDRVDSGIMKWPTSAVCFGPPLGQSELLVCTERELRTGAGVGLESQGGALRADSPGV